MLGACTRTSLEFELLQGCHEPGHVYGVRQFRRQPLRDTGQNHIILYAHKRPRMCHQSAQSLHAVLLQPAIDSISTPKQAFALSKTAVSVMTSPWPLCVVELLFVSPEAIVMVCSFRAFQNIQDRNAFTRVRNTSAMTKTTA